MNEDERLFSAYVRQRPDLRAEYEVLDHEKRPDFRVSGPLGTVVCEMFNPTLKLPGRVGTFDPVRPLRRGTFSKQKVRQGFGAKQDGLPYVIVIGGHNSDIAFDEFDVLLASFGEDPGLRPTKNTRFSAIAIVSAFNPTQHVFDALVAEQMGHSEPAALRWDRIMGAEERLRTAGTFDPDAKLARLRVVHNPWAEVPLNLGWFGGPHDEQFAPETNTATMPLSRVSSGWRLHELPQR